MASVVAPDMLGVGRAALTAPVIKTMALTSGALLFAPMLRGAAGGARLQLLTAELALAGHRHRQLAHLAGHLRVAGAGHREHELLGLQLVEAGAGRQHVNVQRSIPSVSRLRLPETF